MHEIGFFFSMLGAHFSAGHALVFSILIVAALLLTFPLKDKWRIEDPLLPIVSVLGFVTATMAATAVFRNNVRGAFYWNSKYLIYPNLLAAIAFFFLIRRIRHTRWLWPVTTVMVIGMLYTYRVNYLQGRSNFAAENYKLTTWNYYYPDTVRARVITENACKDGIYCRPVKR
jgi:hypothetical protein